MRVLTSEEFDELEYRCYDVRVDKFIPPPTRDDLYLVWNGACWDSMNVDGDKWLYDGYLEYLISENPYWHPMPPAPTKDNQQL